MSRIAIARDQYGHQAAARVTNWTNYDLRRTACVDFDRPAAGTFPTIRLRRQSYSKEWDSL